MKKLKRELRELVKGNFLEKILALLTRGRSPHSLFVKLLPHNTQYPKGSFRLAKIEGINFLLDISDYMDYVLYFGIKVEPRETLYQLVKDNSIIIDIGANIGETLLNFAKINTNGYNFGFEPVPFLFERLQKNIELNNFSNIQVFNVAISDKKENLFFGEVTNNNSGGISMSKIKSENCYQTKSISLDDFIEENNITKIDLIKIDVEGFEMNVLIGGEKSILKYRPTIFVEVDDNNLKRQGYSALSLIKWLIERDYSIQRADTLEKIDDKCDDFRNVHFDVICKFLNKTDVS